MALSLIEVRKFLFEVQLSWYNLGLELGVKKLKLDVIKVKYNDDPSDCLREMVSEWLHSAQNPTWKHLADALKGEVLDQEKLAQKAMDKHSGTSLPANTLPTSLQESDDEQPFYKNKEERREKYLKCKPGRAPKKGTAAFEFLKKFCLRVEVILQTVNENEYQAATTVMEKPDDMFDRAVVFPKNGMVLGMFAEKKTALIQTGMGTKARDPIAEAIKTFPRALYVIGVGVCYAFKREKFKLGDVLVSKKICDLENIKWDSQDRVEDRGERVDVVESLQGIFCRDLVHDPNFKVCAERNSEVYSGTIISHPSLINNKETRDKFHDEIRTAIGGEMEGGQLLQFQLKAEIKGIIAIKGVCDYADGNKAKDWQFISALAALNYTKSKLLYEPSLIDEEPPPQASALPAQPPLSPAAEFKPETPLQASALTAQPPLSPAAEFKPGNCDDPSAPPRKKDHPNSIQGGAIKRKASKRKTDSSDDPSAPPRKKDHPNSIQVKKYMGIDAPRMQDLVTLVNRATGKKFNLAEKISDCWETIGLQLGIEPALLNSIKSNNGMDSERLREVFKRWLDNAAGLPNHDSYPLSWQGLETLLEYCDKSEVAKQYFEFIAKMKKY